MSSLADHGVVVIIRKQDKILFLKDSRDLMLGKWAPPHGRCEDSDESEEGTVVREVYEETGLKVIPTRKIETVKADTKIKTVSFWEADIVAGNIKIDIEESSEFGWFTIEEALKLNLYPGTRKFLENQSII